MAYRITLECGDSSCLRAKKTPEGYTHDWEVFVKGVDNAPIHHFIEKVVFNLHETFQKPKRVIKEPPFVVKESGYAGFDIPIDIYLKNKTEPKRFQIMYNLYLEQSGPVVSHVSHHNHTFYNPSDEFRKKLLKGGAMPISSSESVSEKHEVKTLPMVGKPKLSGNDNKKHRIPEPKLTNSFMDIFGDPVKTGKVSLDKKPVEKPVSSKTSLPVPEKSEKIDKSTKPKHSPHKDSKKDKSFEEKKERRDKEKDSSKDKDKIKDKSKKSSSPSGNKVSHHSSENKKSSSPTLMKKPTTPPLVQKKPASPSLKLKEKESKKIVEPEKEKERSKDISKSTSDESKSEKSEKESKSERKKDKKKHKDDRDKEKKEKHKDKEREKSKDKESVKSVEKKIEKSEKPEKEKSLEIKPQKEERKSPKLVKEIEKVKEEKIPKLDKPEKHKESKSEKSDKSKHKHKKRDKKEKRDGSREREKKEKREKSKSCSEKQEVTNHTSTSSATLRVPEMQIRDSSDSGSDDDESVGKNRTPNPRKESVSPSPPSELLRSMSPPPPPVSDPKKDKSDKKREKSKSSREDKEKRRKRRSESKGLEDEVLPKRVRSERSPSTSPLVEPVSSSQSPIAANLDLVHSKTKHDADTAMEVDAATGDSEQVAPDSTNSTLADPEEPMIFSDDYVSQLKDLQQKIMMLQDNEELQRVVQVIAETGQYEITKKTFDFDLCALDRQTVARLQQFFAS